MPIVNYAGSSDLQSQFPFKASLTQQIMIQDLQAPACGPGTRVISPLSSSLWTGGHSHVLSATIKAGLEATGAEAKPPTPASHWAWGHQLLWGESNVGS